ncbi:E3 SUMO-protein ligase PIAS2-like [Anneissia japonica]|uniref:E3 SUMO-protein ligase PIAS2-like n=1 Tax=Anneissia japonica TaxID=1529436 RepID=UPI001425B3CE|nr:E3 SUMO-protein ligase PIAS2-like [Anneissia japonica]
MSDYLELKRMVMSFRVSELQVLLGFAGRNKSGRKHELQARALNLLKNNCNTPVEIKIKELNRRRFPIRMVSPPQVAVGNSSSSQHSRHTSQTASERISPPNNPSLPQFPQFYPYSSGQHSSQHLGQHIELTSPQPVRPDVKLSPLPFYDVQDDLVKPTGLVPSGKYREVQRTVLFHLTPQQLQMIRESWTPNPRIEYSVQVQLRFCLAETSCEQDDKFPQSVCVKVNNKLCPLPAFLPQSKAGAEPRRPSRPVNITHMIRPNLTEPNRIDVTWAPEFGRQYCVAVYLVKQLTSDILLQRLRSKGFRNADHTRALIKEKLAHDADSEIATTSLRVSLLCPLGKMRMQIPCRASTCTHLQCFDAALYLMMNEKKATWICPVCDKKAPFNLLVLDGLFHEIIQMSPNTNEIHFLQDGRWKPVNSNGKEEAVFVASASRVDNFKDNVTSGSSSNKCTSNSSKPFSKTEVEIVDLTISSDEESDEDIKEPVHIEPATLDFTSNKGCVSPVIISLDSPRSLFNSGDEGDGGSTSSETPTAGDPQTPVPDNPQNDQINTDHNEDTFHNVSNVVSPSILSKATSNSEKVNSSTVCPPVLGEPNTESIQKENDTCTESTHTENSTSSHVAAERRAESMPTKNSTLSDKAYVESVLSVNTTNPQEKSKGGIHNRLVDTVADSSDPGDPLQPSAKRQRTNNYEGYSSNYRSDYRHYIPRPQPLHQNEFQLSYPPTVQRYGWYPGNINNYYFSNDQYPS